MTRRFVAAVAAALVPLAVVVSCDPFGRTTAEPVLDAAPADAAAADASAAADAASDASTDACTSLVDDDFDGGTLGDGWIVAGQAPVVANGEAVLLDADDLGTMSVMWHRAISPRGALLRIDVELRISPIDDTIADGMAIAWAPANHDDPEGTALQHPGAGGQNLGICPAGSDSTRFPGVLALGVETYDGPGPRHRELLDPANTAACGTRLGDVSISKVMPSTLQIRGTQLTGTLAGAVTATLPRAADIGWVGFSAGSGGFGSRQAVAHVHVTSCP